MATCKRCRSAKCDVAVIAREELALRERAIQERKLVDCVFREFSEFELRRLKGRRAYDRREMIVDSGHALSKAMAMLRCAERAGAPAIEIADLED